ncbi:Energy-coupling factor transporter transmembraneprotein EcfT [Candidatus Methanoperedenaceae archaeon GB37]|nr:Energy-coupling factor transporter transmembraneprotein EcfT [Candidatus Methanoperedenaceae archaeon GB37]
MRDFSELIGDLDFERLVVDETALHRLDPRIKLLGAIGLIFAVVSMIHPGIPLLIFLLTLIVSVAIGIPLNTTLKRLIAPLTIAIVVFIVVLFTYGGEEILTVFHGISIHREGLNLGVLIFVRLVASISILNIFIATTPIQDTLSAMKWFRVPPIFVDLMGMMIRYVHLLSKEGVRMHRAQQARCGFSDRLSYLAKMRNIGLLGSALLLRAFSRGECVYLAMLSRGYRSDSRIVKKSRPISLKEILLGSFIILSSFLLVILDRMIGEI